MNDPGLKNIARKLRENGFVHFQLNLGEDHAEEAEQLHRKTNKRAVKEGKPAEWTKEDWERRKPPKSIAIRWMLPAQPRRLTRILTLLQLLRGGYLIGQAALDVEALRVIIRGGKMPLKLSESESWANDIISQERETLSKLRKRCIDGEVLAR